MLICGVLFSQEREAQGSACCSLTLASPSHLVAALWGQPPLVCMAGPTDQHLPAILSDGPWRIARWSHGWAGGRTVRCERHCFATGSGQPEVERTPERDKGPWRTA